MKIQTKRDLSRFEVSALTIMLRFALLAVPLSTAAQTPPPAPTLVAPATGAALVQPITLDWNPVVDPDGPIGSYTWQVGTSSTFGTIIASGFRNEWGDDVPTETHETISGLPNGTYFWRVKATQIVGGAVFSLESPWSQVRSFTVTGLGAAPATPSFTSPANGSAFHPSEFFDIAWTAVAGAQYYWLEVDDEPSFSHPLTLTTSDSMQFGTKFQGGWGNSIPNIYYRVRAVSADNVRSLPSPTLNVRIVNNAPVPPAPALLSPVGGTTVSMPHLFDWSDTANPQIVGYDLDIDDEPNFQGAVGVLLVQGISRSDYLVVPDPWNEGINRFPPGSYFWRVRAIHGSVFGPWSATGTFTVAATPPPPPGLELFWIFGEPGSVYGGNSTQARVTLTQPAGPGGVLVKVATDLPHAQTPASVLIPEGRTDGWVSPITTTPVSGATIGSLRAAFAGSWQENMLGLWPILFDLSFSAERVVGGSVVLGTATLMQPAPPGGVEVTLASEDTSLVEPPPKVFIPAGGMGATFDVATAPVSEMTRVRVNCGTAFENYRAPGDSIVLLPVGSPAPPPSLAALILASSTVPGGGTVTATVTLTGSAPSGGAQIRIYGSAEGTLFVTVPAGSVSAAFTIAAPQVVTTQHVLIQASYGLEGGLHAKLLEVQPAPGVPTLLSMSVKPFQATSGDTLRGTVGLVMPAPPGGGVVTLSTDNPSVIELPASITIPEGNSADSFTVVTRPVALGAQARVDATAGGVTKSTFIYLGANPNAPPPLQSVTITPTSVTGGSTAQGTVTLSSPAPSGGVSITLSTSSLQAAQVPPVVNVPAGQSSANFTVTTFAVSSSTAVTITAFHGSASRTANLTVTSGGAPSTPGRPNLVNPSNGATASQPVALDWSDASGAATYEIQIDNSSNFSAPLVLSLTSTASQTSVSGLAAVQHWWRVRARNSAGVAGNWSSSRRFTPQSAPAPASLSALSVNPSSVVGLNPSQGTVTLTSAAPAGGAVVTLSSSNPSVAAVPASVTVAAGAVSTTFPVTTIGVAANTSVTLSATYNAVSRTATLTVTPPPPPASLASITLNPGTVVGGANSQGTVTLTSAAPAGGATVSLSSSSSSANVPASVTVAAGATTANFTVTTLAVPANTTATITAVYNSVTRTAGLTITPQATGPLPAPSLISPANDARFSPGQNITFDWSDVSGAASYTIQIDDSESFSAPQIVNQTVTASTWASSTLPTRRMWFRVRGNDASGAPGNWSGIRRFEVKD